ncbi:MAG: hypothetical protein CR986_08255 [Ignavibacteriae bacterium]|nr:MAG: hypothetical protein CR986_08255 [Ignavibacteriota bacterium]
MLKNSGIEEERIVAALSLTKMKNKIGIFAVKRKIKFDESKRVQEICKKFYNNYLLEKSKVNTKEINVEFNRYNLSSK